MLILVGAGLGPDYVTKRALEALRSSDVVLVEAYTSPRSSWLVDVVKSLGKEYRLVDRSELEERSSEVVELSRNRNVAVLIAGDPLIATTHSALLVEAAMSGVKTSVIPGVSGPCSAISASGLQFYRFGASATVPGPWRGVSAAATALTLLSNLCWGHHTLLLLDVSPEGETLGPKEALEVLWRELGALGNADRLGQLLALLTSVGDDVTVAYTTLLRRNLPGVEVGSIAVPALLQPIESEYLRYVIKVPEDLIDKHQDAIKSSDFCGLYRTLRERVIA